MRISVPTLMGRSYHLDITRVAIGADVVISADGFGRKLITVKAGETKSLDLAEMFNGIRIAAIADPYGTVIGLDIVTTRRSSGKYRVVLDMHGKDVAVIYDKVTPVQTGTTWRKPQGKTHAS